MMDAKNNGPQRGLSRAKSGDWQWAPYNGPGTDDYKRNLKVSFSVKLGISG